LSRGEAKAVYQAPERPALALTPIPDFALAELNHTATVGAVLARLSLQL